MQDICMTVIGIESQCDRVDHFTDRAGKYTLSSNQLEAAINRQTGCRWTDLNTNDLQIKKKYSYSVQH